MSQFWKLAYAGTVLSKLSQVGHKEFDLGQVKGNIVITKQVTIPTFQTIVVKGFTKVTGHHKHVHILVEPSPKCKNIFVLVNTTEIEPRGISGGFGPPKFIWEGSYLGTPHQSWHDFSCQ